MTPKELKKRRLNKIAQSSINPFSQDEEAILAAAVWLIKREGVTCSEPIFNDSSGNPVSISKIANETFVIMGKWDMGYKNIISDLCSDPNSWNVATSSIPTLGWSNKRILLPATFKGNTSDVNDIISILQVSLFLAQSWGASQLTDLFGESFDSAWIKLKSGGKKLAIQMLQQNYIDSAGGGSGGVGTVTSFKVEIEDCIGWERYIAQTEGKSTVPSDGYKFVRMFYTKRHDGTSYGDGEKVKQAFYQLVNHCRYPNCRYETFVAWYKTNSEKLGREFSPAEAVQMMDKEIEECKLKQTPQTPQTQNSSGNENVNNTPEKEKGCGKNADKNWNSVYVSRLIKELLDLNEPIVMAGPEDFPNSFTQILSPGQVRSLTARYVRRALPGIQRITGSNIKDVADKVTSRLKDPNYDPQTGRYCHSINKDRATRDMLNRSRVFFALQDEFKGRGRSEQSYKDYEKTNKQLGRAGRRRDRYRKMVELPAGGPTPRTNFRGNPKRRIRRLRR